MDRKLQAIIDVAKCGVHLTVNEHRDYHESAESWLSNQEVVDDAIHKEVGDDVWKKMIETDTIIDLQVYPNTPIGFVRVLHHDLESALDAMQKVLGISHQTRQEVEGDE